MFVLLSLGLAGLGWVVPLVLMWWPRTARVARVVVSLLIVAVPWGFAAPFAERRPQDGFWDWQDGLAGALFMPLAGLDVLGEGARLGYWPGIALCLALLGLSTWCVMKLPQRGSQWRRGMRLVAILALGVACWEIPIAVQGALVARHQIARAEAQGLEIKALRSLRSSWALYDSFAWRAAAFHGQAEKDGRLWIWSYREDDWRPR